MLAVSRQERSSRCARCVAAAAVVLLGGCGAASAPAAPAGQTSVAGAAIAATVSPPSGGATAPSPSAAITAGAVPAAAAQAAARFWRLVDARNDAALRGVVTADSQAAAALRAGRGAAFWGINRVQVVSIQATALPAPPAGATLEFAMTVDITPSGTSAWSGGQTLVFMSMRRVDGAWLVYESGSGP